MKRVESKPIFITGTDTEVGKTLVTCGLIEALQNARKSVMAFKPVAAGCDWHYGELCNEDALAIMSTLDADVSYQQVNPIALMPPIAPHIAASEAAVDLSVERLQNLCPLNAFAADFTLVEGAGGWLVPLNDKQSYADYVVAEQLDVLLVVGLKLGCINHALLTQQSIKASGLNLVGWVANHIDPEMAKQSDNVASLKCRLDAPLLGEIPYLREDKSAAQVAEYVNIAPLLASA